MEWIIVVLFIAIVAYSIFHRKQKRVDGKSLPARTKEIGTKIFGRIGFKF
jgi:hypothetical protein